MAKKESRKTAFMAQFGGIKKIECDVHFYQKNGTNIFKLKEIKEKLHDSCESDDSQQQKREYQQYKNCHRDHGLSVFEQYTLELMLNFKIKQPLAQQYVERALAAKMEPNKYYIDYIAHKSDVYGHPRK